jgi:hypothetical protein
MLKILKTAILALAFTLMAAGCATVAEQPRPQLAEAETTAEQSHRIQAVTGSRIPMRTTADGKPIPHASAPVVTFDREALRSTGHRDLEKALFILDPATGW